MSKKSQRSRWAIFLCCLLFLLAAPVLAGEYYIAPDGDDSVGTGTTDSPWKSLTKAVATVPDDGSTIIVRDGLYEGGQSFSRHFTKACRIFAENPYHARFVSPKSSNRVLYVTSASQILLNGLEFFGSGSTNADYLIQLTTENTHNLVFENCIIHDSYKNDLIKINSGANRIIFSGCVFFNPTNHGGDEHFDINMVKEIIVEDSIFFNDYVGSGRPDESQSHSFIVIKNSSTTPDFTEKITLRRNVFFNWSGLGDQAFVLLGEDGKPFFEAQDILVENNLFIHNSIRKIWSTFLYKGGLKNITTRANTITGQPEIIGFGAFSVICLNIGKNPKQESIYFANNLFCDNLGEGKRFSSSFDDCFTGGKLLASNNLYWTGGGIFRDEPKDTFTAKRDANAVLGDPKLPDVPDLISLPRFDRSVGQFPSGNTTIRQEFERLVKSYAVPGKGSAAIGKADPKNMPKNDILGRPRGENPTIGCCESHE